MSSTMVSQPASRLRCGVARVEITPPVGIYHRMWGAARHDRATGVHRPLFGDVVVFAALEGGPPLLVRAYLDMVGLPPLHHDELRRLLGQAANLPVERVVITYSHTHSGGFFTPDRVPLPGGELIGPHLQRVGRALQDTCAHAVASLQSVTITYAMGRCALAANRDYWDAALNGYTCGFNPDNPADDTVVVARITADSGQTTAVLVNYACHPTTLAWANSLLSPDYVGALREEVERVVTAPCIFALGACGDLGPRHGLVGDPGIADQNGRQLAYAALSTLAALGPPLMDYQYAGAVVSGATLGTWAYTLLDPSRMATTALIEGGTYVVELPLKPRPDRSILEVELAQWQARQEEAAARGDGPAAHDCAARAERVRRWLGRLAALPPGTTYPFPFSVHRMGDALWVTCGGEPYNLLQVELRRRFPRSVVVFSPLAGGFPVAYLLPADRYGAGLYQEEPSILAPGCLEALTEAIATRCTALLAG